MFFFSQLLLWFLVVFHDSASKECKSRMGEAYALNQKSNGSVSEEELNSLRRKLEQDQNQQVKPKRQKTMTDWLKTE